MAQQTINVGTAANDGTGDTLRAAFQKTNSNFTENYTSIAAKADTSALTTTNTNVTNLTTTVTAGILQDVVNKTASYTTVAADNRKTFTMSVASANTFTVHATAPAGAEYAVVWLGAGQTTIAVAGTGALLHEDNHTKIAKQKGLVYLKVLSNAGSAPQVLLVGSTAV